jgi:hypothetical protein
MIWQDIILETTISQKVDDLKTAFVKVKNNFDYLKTNTMVGATSVGNGVSIISSLSNSQLNLRSIGSIDGTITVTNDAGVIQLSSNGLVAEQRPRLGGELDTQGYLIYNSRADGSVKIGNGGIIISSDGNGAIISTPSNLNIKSLDANGQINFGTKIFAGTISAIQIQGTTNGLHVGDVVGNISGNLTGTSTGTHHGSVVGDVSGTVSDISTHSVAELRDVSNIKPSFGDIFVWDGNEYAPTAAHAIIPKLSSAQRDALNANSGSLIYNITESCFQGYINGNWVNI